MNATTLKPLIINVGSDVRNPSGYTAYVIPAGKSVHIEENGSRLSSNVWVRYGVHRGKVECGEVSRLIEEGFIRL